MLGGILLIRSVRSSSPLPDWSSTLPFPPEQLLIEYPDRTRSLILERRKDQWYLPQIERPGGVGEVENFLQDIRALQPVNILSQKGPYSPYGLEEEQAFKLRMTGENGETVFYMGKRNETGSYTYFRKDGDPAVYSVRGNWHRTLGIQPEDLRSRQIFSLDPDRIQALSFYTQDQLSILERREKTWYRSGEVPTDQKRIDTYVKRLSQLNCQNFIQQEKTNPVSPLLTVSIRTESGLYTMELLEQQTGGYLARSEGVSDNFILNSYDGNTLRELSGF